MIFTPHIIVGATIGAKTQNLGLIILLALLFHIIMDKIPHWDYTAIKYVNKFKKTKKIKHLFPIILKSLIDVVSGLLIAFLILWNTDLLSILPFVLLGIFFSVLLDIINTIAYLLPYKGFAKISIDFHEKFHDKKIKEGEITFLSLATQIIVILICVFLLNL